MQRLVYNDLAKALGMLLIIWGHIRLTGWSNSFVYAFHIPLFFALSGMVFNKAKYHDFTAFFKKKFNSLIIPYILFSFITWIVWAVFVCVSHQQVDSFWMPLLETFIARGSGGYLVHNVPLWFISCLFVMELLYYFMADLKRLWIMITSVIMAVISFIAINYFSVIDFTAIPWNIETAFLGMPFYAAGHWAVCSWGHQGMISWVSKHKCLSWMFVLVSILLVILGSSYNGSISFGHDDLGKNAFLAYGLAFLGVIMMLVLCMLLSGIKVKGVGEKLMRSIIWFGRNSYNAMVIHNPIKGIICVIVGVLLHCSSSIVSKNTIYSFIAFVGTLIVTVTGILFINWAGNKLSKTKY